MITDTENITMLVESQRYTIPHASYVVKSLAKISKMNSVDKLRNSGVSIVEVFGNEYIVDSTIYGGASRFSRTSEAPFTRKELECISRTLLEDRELYFDMDGRVDVSVYTCSIDKVDDSNGGLWRLTIRLRDDLDLR